MIDIPCEEPQHITTCQETGNLCVTTGGTVKIYRLVEKTIPNSYITYHDIEMFLQLSFELPVSMASLCEDYFACCTVDTAQVHFWKGQITNHDCILFMDFWDQG